MVKATIVGARGYLGRELLRLLLQHPEVDAVVPASTSEAGQPVAASIPALRHHGLRFYAPGDSAALDADAVFLAAPPGEAAVWVEAYEQAGAKTVIDLSRDHRTQALQEKDGWTYGLADVLPVAKGTRRIANPGCYPTASLLAMAPALQGGLVGHGPIIVDGKSGVSGAGISPRADLHFPEMNETVRAYKVLGHDHTEEIERCANRLNGAVHKVRFTPHLVPQTRGLLATAYLPLAAGVAADDVQAAYESAYATSRFVRLGAEPSTGAVRLSNLCDVAVDVDPGTGLIVARGAIDNLVKGGSGTAVQNMNDALGLATDAGLGATGGGL